MASVMNGTVRRIRVGSCSFTLLRFPVKEGLDAGENHGGH